MATTSGVRAKTYTKPGLRKLGRGKRANLDYSGCDNGVITEFFPLKKRKGCLPPPVEYLSLGRRISEWRNLTQAQQERKLAELKVARSQVESNNQDLCGRDARARMRVDTNAPPSLANNPTNNVSQQEEEVPPPSPNPRRGGIAPRGGPTPR